jgi:hypothetical protein
MLSNLFQATDYILFQGSDDSKRPQGLWVSNASEASLFDSAVYYSINPIHPTQNLNTSATRSPRCSLNVTAFRNFLFEIDKLDLDTQYALLNHIKALMPPTQVVFSGSSSLHLVYSVADTLPFKPHTDEGIQQYSQAWRAISAELTEHASNFLGPACPSIVFDPSCKDPSRLSRVPNAIRPDNGNVQSELDGFGTLIDSETVLRLMAKHGFTSVKNPAPAMPQVPEMDLKLMHAMLLIPENAGLYSKISKVADWASSENMYPVLFQLTLWVIDATGAPLNTTLAYFEKQIFPAIRAANYNRNPAIAIHNAYIWKGLA